MSHNHSVQDNVRRARDLDSTLLTELLHHDVLDASVRKSNIQASDLHDVLVAQDKSVLLPLLSIYSETWRHSNNQVWTIGAIFIPLSLSGIALGVSDLYQTIIVAVFSVTLIWIWFFMSERLRSLADENWKVYSMIESIILGIDYTNTKRGISDLNKAQRKRLSLKKLRRSIPISVSVVWLIAIAVSILSKTP